MKPNNNKPKKRNFLAMELWGSPFKQQIIPDKKKQANKRKARKRVTTTDE